MPANVVSPASVRFRTRIVTTIQDFEQLANDWSDLFQRTGKNNINLSHTWLKTLLHYFPPKALLVITVWNTAGEMVAAAPLKIGNTQYGIFRRLLRYVQFIGSEPYLYEWMTFLCDPAYDKPSLINHIAQALWTHRHLWDVIELRYAHDSQELALLSQSLKLYIHSAELSVATQNPYLPLGSSYQSYRASLKKNMKSNINRRRNRLESDFPSMPLTLEVYPPSYATNKQLDRLFENHIQYWKSRGIKSNFKRHAQLSDFYKTLYRVCHDVQPVTGRLELTTLNLGEIPISTMLGFWNGNHYMTHLLNHNPNYRPYDPGMLHFDFLARHIIEHGGNTLDFGRGEEEYKSRWTDQALTLWHYRAYKTHYSRLHWQADGLIKDTLDTFKKNRSL